jgi:hypothetical protein
MGPSQTSFGHHHHYQRGQYSWSFYKCNMSWFRLIFTAISASSKKPGYTYVPAWIYHVRTDTLRTLCYCTYNTERLQAYYWRRAWTTSERANHQSTHSIAPTPAGPPFTRRLQRVWPDPIRGDFQQILSLALSYSILQLWPAQISCITSDCPITNLKHNAMWSTMFRKESSVKNTLIIVACIPSDRQRVGKHIPETQELNNKRTSIAR